MWLACPEKLHLIITKFAGIINMRMTCAYVAMLYSCSSKLQYNYNREKAYWPTLKVIFDNIFLLSIRTFYSCMLTNVLYCSLWFVHNFIYRHMSWVSKFQRYVAAGWFPNFRTQWMKIIQTYTINHPGKKSMWSYCRTIHLLCTSFAYRKDKLRWNCTPYWWPCREFT